MEKENNSISRFELDDCEKLTKDEFTKKLKDINKTVFSDIQNEWQS